MIQVNGDEVKIIWYNDMPVFRVYLGSRMVYTNNRPIPNVRSAQSETEEIEENLEEK